MKKVLFLALLCLFSSVGLSYAGDLSLQTLEDQALSQQNAGNYDQAQTLWQELQQRYKKEGLTNKADGATIQLALSQESLGQLVTACQTLQALLNINESICIPAREAEVQPLNLNIKTQNDAIAAINMARMLRDLGAFDYALSLTDAANQANHPDLSDDIAIARGNILGAKLRQAFDQWQFQGRNNLLSFEVTPLIAEYQVAFQAYESAFTGDSSLDARLKWIQLYQSLSQQTEAYQELDFDELLVSKDNRATELINEILSLTNEDFQHLVETDRLRLLTDRAQILIDRGHPDSKEAIQTLIEAAHSQDEYLAWGYAMLGQWYQQEGMKEQTIRAYHQASILGGPQHPLYQWQYQIARTFQNIGNQRQAERYYESAIALLESVQQDISPIERSLRLHFQESVRPIYENYSAFEMSNENPDIAKVFNLQSRYQEKVVEVYLGCGTLENVNIEEVTQQDPSAAYLSIFRVNGSYYTLLKQGNNYSYRTIAANDVDPSLNALETIFATTGRKVEVSVLNSYLNDLHKAILEPIQNELTPMQMLVFVGLDPAIQQVPMAALYDGEEYLIQKHPVGLITNSLRGRSNSRSFNSLFVGLSDQANPNFEELPYVAEEAVNIDPQQRLLNEQFTRSRLSQSIQNDFDIVHIATHGQFSSNPEETFLLAWDQKLKLPDIRAMVKERALNRDPIDLLILSACETAKGDRLANLGIAGISIESGATTTIASIWQAIDSSSPFFMQRLYTHLRAGETKARAVQLAQLDMIQEEYLPYSWAPYILTGDWN